MKRKMRRKNEKSLTALSGKELKNVVGGQAISVPVRLKQKISLPKTSTSGSIAQLDSPYETDDNLPT